MAEEGAKPTDVPPDGPPASLGLSFSRSYKPKAQPADDPSRDFKTALALHQRGRFAEAEKIYGAILRADPHNVGALHHMGLLRADQGRLDEAMSLLETALCERPEAPDLLLALGMVQQRLGYHEHAIACFTKALSFAPADIRVLDRLNNLLIALNRAEEAVPHIRRAVDAAPEADTLHHMLGTLLFGLGEIEDARACFEKAVALRPDSGRYFRSLADAKCFRDGDEHLTRMEALARQPLPAPEQSALSFALAKALTDPGRNGEAFQHLRRANALMRRMVPYNETATLVGLDHLKTVFTAELLRARADVGDPSERPVFIVGMPRSGTTLVEQILASHPDVAGAGESRVLETAFAGIAPPERFPAIVPQLSGDQLRRLGAAYVQQLALAGPDAKRITDKLPLNFMRIGLIRLVLPNARIIHVTRDPVDTCLSCFGQEFGPLYPFVYDLGELGRYYRGYRDLMAYWREVLPEGAMLEIAYENIVGDLEGSARRLVACCGLDWNADCLAFHKTKRGVWSASAAQVREPIFKTSIGHWRPDTAYFAPLRDGLGPYAG